MSFDVNRVTPNTSFGAQNIGFLGFAGGAKTQRTTTPSLQSIEREYQVAQEATRDWSPKLFGSIPMGGIGGTRELTLTEGRLLDNLTRDRGIMGLREFSNIADNAFATADARVPRSTTMPQHVRTRIDAEVARYPADQQARAREILEQSWPANDGHNDAFRHAYWNARLTSEFGAEWTRQFTTAHEGSNPGSSTREAMDLYNNEVGRRIATENPSASPQQLADLVMQAMNDGKLVVINQSGHLSWSNQVARNNHGITISLDAVPARLNTPPGNASAN